MEDGKMSEHVMRLLQKCVNLERECNELCGLEGADEESVLYTLLVLRIEDLKKRIAAIRGGEEEEGEGI